MHKKSTLLLITDTQNGKTENELIDIDAILDPLGESNKELDAIFTNINFSPSPEIIRSILMQS